MTIKIINRKLMEMMGNFDPEWISATPGKSAPEICFEESMDMMMFGYVWSVKWDIPLSCGHFNKHIIYHQNDD